MLQTRQSGNLPFSFGGMTRRSMPPRFKAPCSLWRVFADIAKTSTIPWLAGHSLCLEISRLPICALKNVYNDYNVV